MKYFSIFIISVLSLFVLLYVALFSSLGNNLLKPFIEKEIQKQTTLDSRLELFSLNSSSVELLLFLNKNNSIYFKANYSLLNRSFNGAYRIKFLALQTLKTLTHTELQGSMESEGNVVGNMDFFRIKGISDIASSDTTYQVDVKKLQLSSLNVSITSAHLKKLLFMLKKKAYADAKINLALDFKNITPHKLDGQVKLTTTNGYFNTQILKKEFGITVPKDTKLAMELDANFKGDNVKYTYFLNSNLAKMSLKGMLVPQPLSLDLAYSLDVKELKLLKPLSGLDVQGALQVSGEVKGDRKNLAISAKTDFASSDTKIALSLHEWKPKNIEATIRGLKVQKLLYMLKKPHFTDANLDMDVSIKNATMGSLEGMITTKISDGRLDSRYFTKAFAFSSVMPKVDFLLNSSTKLQGNSVLSSVDVSSNLLHLHTKNTVYNMKKSSFKSDYTLRIKNLNDFYFISQRHFKGGLLAKGNISQSKDLDFDMYTDIADGRVKIKLHNDKVIMNLKALKTVKLLDILLYPKIFDAVVNGDMHYDLKKESGNIVTKITKGRVLKNQIFDLAKRYAHTDMYKENFAGDMQATIIKKRVVGSLLLNSNNSSIKSKNAKLNLKSNVVDAVVEIDANHNLIKVRLTGDVKRPKVKISADELIKHEAKKVINKEVGEFLRKFF